MKEHPGWGTRPELNQHLSKGSLQVQRYKPTLLPRSALSVELPVRWQPLNESEQLPYRPTVYVERAATAKRFDWK